MKKKVSSVIKTIKMTNFAYVLSSIVLTRVVLLDAYASEYNFAKVNGYTEMTVSLIIMIMGLTMIINIYTTMNQYLNTL